MMCENSCLADEAVFAVFIEWTSCSYRFTSLSWSIDFRVVHIACVVGLPRCLSVESTRFLSIASLTVIKRLIVVSLFDVMIIFELVQMRLQALFILQIVLEEDILLGFRSYESIFDWWTTLTHHLTLLSCHLLWVEECVICCLGGVLRRFNTYVAHLTLVLRAKMRVKVGLSWYLLRGAEVCRHWLAEGWREPNSDVAEAETVHLHIIVIAG